MTAFPKYPAYKDSGVAPIGRVPDHWEVLPLFSQVTVKSERNTADRELLSVYLDRGVIRFTDVDEKRTNATSEDLSAYQAVDPGDFVLNNQQAWRGSVGVSNLKGIVSPAYLVLKLNPNWNHAFANYLVRTSAMVDQYLVCSKGVGTIQRNLYYPSLKRASILVPPRTEQDRIVAFLDEKTAQIDALIAKKRRQIELLDEQKAILINRAVTRGLHPNPDLKDSGIEGVGRVPAHWRIVQNRRLFTEKSRKITSSDEMPLSLSQVDGVIPSDEMKERSLSPSHRDNFKLCLPGDLILNRFKAHLGVFFQSPFRGAITYHYGVFEPHEGIQTKYFEFLFHTEAYRTIYAGVSNGMSIGLQNLSNNNFYQVLSVVPPEEEQVAIVKHAEQVVSGVLSTIERINSQIQTLQTLRSTLIAHAVTGKIKV